MNYQATKEIIEALELALVDFDSKVIESTVAHYKVLSTRLIAAKLEYASISHNAFSYYPKLFAAAGGKGNYTLLQYGVGVRVEEIIRKSEKTKISKRNIRISKKLIESNITKVTSASVILSDYGFNGVFDVETDAGSKRVVVETIFAGGYNVQCAHLRVLVKVI